VRSFVEPDLFDNNVGLPCDNTTPIYLKAMFEISDVCMNSSWLLTFLIASIDNRLFWSRDYAVIHKTIVPCSVYASALMVMRLLLINNQTVSDVSPYKLTQFL